MLGSSVDAAEELVEAHEYYCHNKYGSVDVNILIHRKRVRRNKERSNRLDYEEKSCACHEHYGFIG